MYVCLGEHNGVVHDIAWAPVMGRSHHLIATASRETCFRVRFDKKQLTWLFSSPVFYLFLLSHAREASILLLVAYTPDKFKLLMFIFFCGDYTTHWKFFTFFFCRGRFTNYSGRRMAHFYMMEHKQYIPVMDLLCGVYHGTRQVR